MGDILLRTAKDAFEVVSPEHVVLANTIADNVGNLIFRDTTQRVLETANTRVIPDRHVVGPDDADMINERFDAYVLPLANAFRIGYERTLIHQTALIRRLRIPVVVLGVGHQADVDNNAERIAPISGLVKDFVSAVLDRGPSIGVRGEMTADYLHGLGFNDVEVIGCPSMFLHGDRMEIRPRAEAITTDAKVAITVSPYRTAMTPIVNNHTARYPNLIYLPQDVDTLELMLWNRPAKPVAADDPRPVQLRHPLFQQDRVRFFVAPQPWFDFLGTRDFTFGSRIHGTIASLVAGTPAFLLAHDSRTLELARYFGIPHRLLRDVDPETVDAAELYQHADTTDVVAGHRERFERFTGFLDTHKLDHAFRSPAPQPDYFTRAETTVWPAAVTAKTKLPLWSASRLPAALRPYAKKATRLALWRRTRLRRDIRH
jgi:hypothetical protein